MQFRALSNPNGRLSFDKVAPPEASTRHVAGAAFYHCLGEDDQEKLFKLLTPANSVGDEEPGPAGTRGAVRNGFHDDLIA